MRAYLVALALAAHHVQAQDSVAVVSKITNSLRAMSDNLEKEGREDGKDMDRMQCWCEATIADASATIKSSGAASAAAAAVFEKNTGIANAEDAAAATAAEKSADYADKIKKAQNADASAMKLFTEKETAQNQMISQLDTAINQLKGGQEASSAAAGNFMQKYGFLQAPAGEGSYASNTGGIMGALTNMLADNKNDKKMAAEAEAERHGGKLKEISAYSQMKNEEDAKHSQASEKAAAAKAAFAAAAEDKENNDAINANNRDKHDKTSKTCAAAAKAHAERVSDRSSESQSIANGLSILEANRMDLLNNANFIQVSDLPKTSLLATQMLATMKRNGPKALLKVKEEIDKLTGHLEDEKSNEAAMYNTCLETDRQLESDHLAASNGFDSKSSARDNAQDRLESKNDLISNLNEKIHGAISSVKHASEERSDESVSYQKKIDNQNQVINVISQVERALSASYDVKDHQDDQAKKNRAALLEDDHATGEVNMRNAGRKKQDSGAVMTLLQNVRQKSEADMHSMFAEEMDNRAEYGAFVRDTVQDIRSMQDSAAVNSGTATQLTQDISEYSGDSDNFKDERDGLKKSLDEQKGGPCKKLKSNFQTWQAARADEIDGLKSASGVFEAAADQYSQGAGTA